MRGGVCENRHAVDSDVSAVRNLQRGQRAHERRLACAVRSEEAKEPRADGQVNSAKRLDAVRVAHGHTGDFKHTAGMVAGKVMVAETSFGLPKV